MDLNQTQNVHSTIREGKKMTETQNQLASWDDVQLKTATDFVKFQDPDAQTGIPVEQVFVIKNWQLFWADEKDYNDKNKTVRKVKFTADVVAIDGKLVTKKISTSSSRFINAVKPRLKDKTPTVGVYLSIMKVGKDNATNYVVKEVPATELYK